MESAGGGRRGAGGLKGGRLSRDGPFQCQFTAIPAVKSERGGKVRVLPISFPDLLV